MLNLLTNLNWHIPIQLIQLHLQFYTFKYTRFIELGVLIESSDRSNMWGWSIAVKGRSEAVLMLNWPPPYKVTLMKTGINLCSFKLWFRRRSVHAFIVRFLCPAGLFQSEYIFDLLWGRYDSGGSAIYSLFSNLYHIYYSCWAASNKFEDF